MNTLQPRKSEAGFTLVELAIVMVIIGLLIGGILKGQELIANAKVTATVGQINGIDGAMSTFRDKYGALPGDMLNAATRIPNCLLANCGAQPASVGNGRIDSVGVGIFPTANTENQNAFRQLAAADILSGIDPAGGLQFGTGIPSGKLGGGFFIAFDADGTIANFAAAADGLSAGHYITYTGALADVAAGGGVITATQAAAIDRKMDDGIAGRGTVVGDAITPGATGCRLAAGPAGLYNEAQNVLCSLLIRTQG